MSHINQEVENFILSPFTLDIFLNGLCLEQGPSALLLRTTEQLLIEK